MTFADLQSGDRFRAWPVFTETYVKSGGYGHAYRLTDITRRAPVIFQPGHPVEKEGR